jgi:hypothetical protein
VTVGTEAFCLAAIYKATEAQFSTEEIQTDDEQSGTFSGAASGSSSTVAG